MTLPKPRLLSTLAALGLALFLPAQTEAQLFGWKKKTDSSGVSDTLFPSESADGSISTSTPSTPENDQAIFRNGEPEEVGETSYVIRDGRKVFTDERRGLFRRKSKKSEDEVPATAPPAEYPETSESPATVTETPTDSGATPEPRAGDADRNFGFRPFSALRRKKEPVSPFAISDSADSLDGAPSAEGDGPPAAPRADVPQFDVESAEESDEKRFSFNPLARLRRDGEPEVPRMNEETEILVPQDGGLAPVGESTEGGLDYNIMNLTEESPSGPASPPREEDGSIIYESWDDVKATRQSAADLIVQNMKAQEAERKRRIEEARRQYEEQVRKAQEEARIRAIMQGATPGLGASPGLGSSLPGFPGESP